jgi:hypothetical protein
MAFALRSSTSGYFINLQIPNAYSLVAAAIESTNPDRLDQVIAQIKDPTLKVQTLITALLITALLITALLITALWKLDE